MEISIQILITLLLSPAVAIFAYHYGDYLKRKKLISRTCHSLKINLNNFQNKLTIGSNLPIEYRTSEFEISFILTTFPISIMNSILKSEMYTHLEEETQKKLHDLLELVIDHNELIGLRERGLFSRIK